MLGFVDFSHQIRLDTVLGFAYSRTVLNFCDIYHTEKKTVHKGFEREFLFFCFVS